MGKAVFLVVAFFLVAVIISETNAHGNCPQRTNSFSCNPSCYSDSDCSFGKLCCENSCNSKSCMEKAQGSSSGSKGSSSGGTGVYCNNVKCRPNEKCGLDKSSNRQKCVRQ